MKKIMISLMLALITLTSCSQNQTNKASVNETKQIDKTTLVYKLYPTQNMWTFIKLNTRNGKLWQVQYDIKGDNRFESDLNTTPLVSIEKESNERFTLYSTQNIYSFILLDQIDGRMWQAQWSIEPNNRFIIPIE